MEDFAIMKFSGTIIIMMINKELFIVENKVQERLRNKYRTFTTEVIESRVGPNKIQIQLGIAEKYLKISDEELKKKFNELCMAFLGTCHKYQVPCKPLYILILTDEEIDRGLQIKLKNEKDGSLWNIVFIPPADLNAPYAFWHYTFLHELGHCWINIKYKDLETEEIFTDLVAIAALERIIPPHSRLFKETIKLRSYTGGEQGKEYFGKDLRKKVLKDPGSRLKIMLNLIKKKGQLTQ